MSISRADLTLDFAESPGGARILPGTLEQYAVQRRANREERLRSEGYDSATQSAAQALDSAAQTLEDLRAELHSSVVETSIQLALEIAGELIHKEVSQGNHDMTAIVRQALTSASNSSRRAVLHVNPKDAEALAEIPFRSGTEVESDPAVRQGDVQLDTDQGLLVRNMDECLSSIRENLREAFRAC